MLKKIFSYFKKKPEKSLEQFEDFAKSEDFNSQLLKLSPEVIDPFTSKFDFADDNIDARLQDFNWFSNCGKSFTEDLTVEVFQVSSLSEAIEFSESEVWENVELEARNQLTIWLNQNHKDKYQDWNKITELHKVEMSVKLEPIWNKRKNDLNFSDIAFSSIQWDVLSALMEHSYKGTGHNSFFFSELMKVYEAGHFPCGWIGKWPSGKLVVY